MTRCAVNDGPVSPVSLVSHHSHASRAARRFLLTVMLVACSALAIAPIASAAPSAHAKPDRPNVLFIAVDDMRVELNCYGQTHIHSPNIDRLAKRGTLFTRAYCQQAVCNPSRASLLTGLRPDTLRVWDLLTHFRQTTPKVVTLPQQFKNSGYYAQNVGKIFHNWRQDDFKGDAVSWSAPEVMHYNTHGADKAMVKLKQGETPPPDLIKTPRCEMRDVPDDAYFDGRIAKLAVKALGELKQRKEPWFLGVGFWKPHAAFNAPKKYWDLYKRSEIKPPANPTPPKRVPKIAMHDGREIMRGFRKQKGGKPTPQQVITLRHGYYAAISYVDAQVGKVVDELDRLGLADNTVIVFWSDHGFHLGEQGLWAKTSNFELDARVPLIIATPKGMPGGAASQRGQRTDALVELLDLYPTLADLCGLKPPANLQGKSLRPLLENPKGKVKDAAFTQHTRPAYPDPKKGPDAMGWAMRTDRYRYVEWRDFKTGKVVATELYDHSSDPDEMLNRAGEPKQQAMIEQLAGQLAETAPRRGLKP